MAADTPRPIRATLTLTATNEATPNGLLVSMHSEGDYADEVFARLFYSIGELPPEDLAALNFWSSILVSIGGMLGSD